MPPRPSGPRRPNPIPPRDERYNLDPMPIVEGTVMEDSCADEDDAGLFHVTTSLPKVFADGRLRSRRDVGAIGLGGGTEDRGHHVSFVINYSRALWLYDAMRSLRLSMEDQRADDALRAVVEWTGFPNEDVMYLIDSYDYEYGGEDGLDNPVLHQVIDLANEMGITEYGDPNGLLDARTWQTLINENEESINEEWSGWEGPYKLVQRFEAFLHRNFTNPDRDEMVVGIPTVGFTATPAQFRAITPEDLAIVQAGFRDYDGADVVLVPAEMEVRLPPDGIQLVAVGVERPGTRLPIPPRRRW